MFPVLLMVGVAPAGGDVTSGPLAATVSGDDGSALRVGKRRVGAAHIQGFRVGTGDDPRDGAVTEEPFDVAPVEGAGERPVEDAEPDGLRRW